MSEFSRTHKSGGQQATDFVGWRDGATIAIARGMRSILFAVALAGCGTNPAATLPTDAHYRVLFNPWPTMGQCLEHEPDPAACAVPLALSLCKDGRAVFHKNGALEPGTYTMDD